MNRNDRFKPLEQKAKGGKSKNVRYSWVAYPTNFNFFGIGITLGQIEANEIALRKVVAYVAQDYLNFVHTGLISQNLLRSANRLSMVSAQNAVCHDFRLPISFLSQSVGRSRDPFVSSPAPLVEFPLKSKFVCELVIGYWC